MTYKKIIIHTVKESWEEDTPVTETYVTETIPTTYEAKRKVGGVFSTVENEDTPLGISLRQDMREFYSKVQCLLDSYIEAKSQGGNGASEVEFLKTEIPKRVSTIMEVLRGWIRMEDLAELSTSTISFYNDLISMIDGVSGGAALETDSKIQADINVMSDILRRFNTFALASTGINDLWKSYVDSVHRQVVAHKAKDWSTEYSTKQSTYKILVAGPELGTRSIADVISIAIIDGQQWRFK